MKFSKQQIEDSILEPDIVINKLNKEIKTIKTNSMIQSVTLEFNNTIKATFTGPAVVFDENIRVTKITFSEPELMPPNCSWETIREKK
jgi:hypothetical protein